MKEDFTPVGKFYFWVFVPGLCLAVMALGSWVLCLCLR